MRILFDARSVRTPAGRYVFRGLAGGWRADPRVAEVLAAVPADFDRGLLPAGVKPVPLPAVGWMTHVRRVLPRIADAERADVIFSPNGFPPRDPRAVIYFQDLFHFRPTSSEPMPPRLRAENLVRAAWRARAAPACRLAVPVSSDIRDEVARRVRIPIVMIPNGIDVYDVRWTGARDVILVLGGRGPRKDEATAIRAWADAARGARPAMRLVVIGAEPEARRAELAALAESLGVGDSVEVRGTVRREEMLRAIAECRLAVSCSAFEAFGLPVGEALAIGAPVAASALPSHVELLERADAGASFPVGDHAALARILGDALRAVVPPRLTEPPRGWSWRERASEHIDAYLRYS